MDIRYLMGYLPMWRPMQMSVSTAEGQREYNVGGITGKGFLRGRSGNPGGRPKGRSLRSLLREYLDRTEINGVPNEGGKSNADLVVEALIRGASKGDAKCQAILWDRLEGKVPNKHQISGDGGTPLVISLVEAVKPDGVD
jgi:Family of unknown function (DUF5681)